MVTLIVWFNDPTEMVWVWALAAAYRLSPGWLVVIVQVPVARNVTTPDESEHTVVCPAVIVNVGVSPDVAVAAGV
jgi:hypothetical protein